MFTSSRFFGPLVDARSEEAVVVIDTVVQQADGWLQSIVARHRDDKTSQAATLVHDGAILVATMHDYKNTSLDTYLRVIAVAEVNPDRDALPDVPQRRRAAYDDMRTFETHQELLHAAGRALESLTNPAASSRIVAHARGLPELIDDGRAFARVTRHLYDSKNEQMRRYQRGQTTDFHRALHANAPHPDIARYARSMLEVIRPLDDLLVQANTHYVWLRNSLQTGYHLPAPPELRL